MIDLKGKRGLIVGVANDNSIAWGCAKAMHEAGAEIAMTYLNEKAKKFVEPLAEQVNAPIFMPLNVQNEDEMDALFYEISQKWGKIDFFVHSIAFAPMKDLHGRVVDCSQEGFLQAMDTSCHSFIRMGKRCEPLMTDGGAMLTVSYYGSEKVVDNYNMMGPVKAALESSVRYMAMDLGSKGIRVNAISPGPILTRAASGIAEFDELIAKAKSKTPSRELATIEDVGNYATFLASRAAKNITGDICYVDAGYKMVG